MSSSRISRILSEAERRYGSFESPTYFFVMETYSREPHKELLARLSGLGYTVQEKTDPNTEVCFTYCIGCQNENYVLQLSMVGPYAVLLRWPKPDGAELVEPASQPETNMEANIRNLVSEVGFHFLGLQELTHPLKMRLYVNDNPEDVRLYHVLFTDTYGLPWDKPSQP